MRLQASSDTLAIGLVFIGIATLACLSPVQSDTWWLLRAGSEIWQGAGIPLADTYSHTAAGFYWPNHEWLSEALFFALFRLGGAPLLTLFCAAAIVGAWAMSWRLTAGAFESRFAIFVLSLVSVASAWAVRPQVFTMLLFAAVVVALVARRYVLLPLIMLIWANLHGAVALGLLAMAAAAAALVIYHRRIPWTLCIAGVASGAATFLTPLGYKLWTFIPESMAKSRVNQLIEWQPPGFSAAYIPFWTLTFLLVAAGARYWRRLDVRAATLLAIALAMLPLAARSVRNVSIFAIVAVPALTSILASASKSQPRRLAGERGGVNFVLLALFAIAGATVVAMMWRLPAPPLGWQPISAAAVVAIRACDAPLYNTYDDGGVLIWWVREKPVFVDNRQDPYPLEFLRAAHAVEAGENPQPLFDKHGIGCAAVPADAPLVSRLLSTGEWQQTYRDARWSVLVKTRR